MKQKRMRKDVIQYPLYKPFLADLAGMIRKRPRDFGLSGQTAKTIGHSQLIEKAMLLSVHRSCSCDDFTDLARTAEEWEMERAGNPTVFLENQHLINMLHHSRIDIPSDNIVIPGPAHSSYFSFPSTAFVEGVNIIPCYCACTSPTQVNSVIDNVLNAAEIPGPHPFLHASNSLCFILAFRMRSEIWHFPFSEEELDECLQSHSVRLSHLPTKGKMPTDDVLRMASILLRLCVGTCYYVQAYPHSCRSGFPSEIENSKSLLKAKRRCLRIGVYSRKEQRVLTNKECQQRYEQTGSGKKMHLRRSHFRRLEHPRYRRNPNGTARIVHVEHSIINARIDPHTVTDLSASRLAEVIDVLALRRKGSEQFNEGSLQG